MKILVLAPDVPATSGMPGSPRLFNLCRELSRRHDLFLLTYCSSEDRYRAFLADSATTGVFRQVEILPDPPQTVTWWGQQWHRMHLAAHFETRYRQRDYFLTVREMVRDICRHEKVDMLYVDLLSMTQYVDRNWGIPAVVDLHDSSTIMGRKLLRLERGWRKRIEISSGWMRHYLLERSLGHTFDLILTNSAVDEAAIRRLSAGLNTLTITNGVDTEYFSPGDEMPEAEKIVFTGVMAYAPNHDAALYFAEKIFPLVRLKRPAAQYWIVGSNPQDQVKALTRVPGIHITGQVEDVRPYVRSAAVFVCPLRVGAGVKNKILAALAMQKAVVATSMSVDGLDLRDNREVLLADDPEAFASRVVRVLTDENEARRLAANGLSKVRTQYSWSAMGKALETAIESVIASRNGRRSGRT
jgi:glycosyltransferase involved in cell wall biosynthesis